MKVNMSKILFDELEIKPQRRFRKSYPKKYDCVGLDTETYKGKCKLICDSYGIYNEPETFNDIARFLTETRYVNKKNFFFNLRYDFQSLIKFLPIELIYELYSTNECYINDIYDENIMYHLFYLEKKFFRIKKMKFDDNNNDVLKRGHCSFYDLASFLEGSLDSLSEKYLGEHKIDTIDSSRLNEDINYWNENKEEIIKYCLYDAKLTKMLADKFWKLMFNALDFLPKYPFSKGALSQEYFIHKCNFIPRIERFFRNMDNSINDCRLNGILRYAYEAYSGGRFELLKRGYFKEVYLYDIKSAYPSEIANLIDFTRGKWRKTVHYDRYNYGYWYCDINFYHSVISPFMQKSMGLNIYPNGKFKTFLTKNEINFIFKNFKGVSIDPIAGYGFILEDLQKPFLPFCKEINKLYNLKENEENEEIKLCYKLTANSCYGKFWQQVGGHTGKLWNPMYATEITANTRLKLLDAALKNNIKNIIGFSTDSIFSEKPLKLKQDSKLGSWELKYKGKNGIFLMTDIYSLQTDNGDKHKMRGFKIKLNKNDKEYDYITVYNILNKLGEYTRFKYKVKRPLNLGEVIMQYKAKDLSMLNVWRNDERIISINGDIKRIWENKFNNAYEPFEITHTSEPILIGKYI